MDQPISCVKVINKLKVKKISYKSCYHNNQIYHQTKIYFYDHNHVYYDLNKPTDISIGDLVNMTYIKYNHCHKRYLKSITFHQYYIQPL